MEYLGWEGEITCAAIALVYDIRPDYLAAMRLLTVRIGRTARFRRALV
jgi:hypothetical protein